MSDHDSSVSGDAIRATPHTVAADGEIFSIIPASAADAASEAFWDHVAEEFTIETVYGMRLYITYTRRFTPGFVGGTPGLPA